MATFDFTAEVDAGESIFSAVVSVSLLAGTDATPSALLTGSPVIAAGTVLQPFHAGVDGVTYTLRCVATLTPTGRVLVLAANLPVRTA